MPKVTVKGRTEEEEEKKRREAREFIAQREKRKAELVQQGLAPSQAAAQFREELRAEVSPREAEMKRLEEERAKFGVQEEVARGKIQEFKVAEPEKAARYKAIQEEEQEFKPIISPELENLGVVGDIAKSLITSLPFSKYDIIAKVGRRSLLGSDAVKKAAEERVSEAEIAMQTATIDNALQTEIGKEYDKKIDNQITQMGLPLGIIGAAVGGAIIGGLTQPFAQFVGTDKKVRNLNTAITKLQSIGTDIASTVKEGSMDGDIGLDKIERIEKIINWLEAELQLAATESANVRISLKSRDVSATILAARTKLNDAELKIVGFIAMGIYQPSPIHLKAIALDELKK